MVNLQLAGCQLLGNAPLPHSVVSPIESSQSLVNLPLGPPPPHHLLFARKETSVFTPYSSHIHTFHTKFHLRNSNIKYLGCLDSELDR